MAGEEIRVGRRVWVRDPDSANGRALGQIAAVLPRFLADDAPAFVVKLDSKPTVITCRQETRGEHWDFTD